MSDLRKAVNLASVEEKPTIQAILDKAQSALPASERSKPVIETPTSQMPTSVEEPGSPSENESADGEIEVGYSLEVFMRAELRHSTSNFHAKSTACYYAGILQNVDHLYCRNMKLQTISSLSPILNRLTHSLVV